jgi:hypothetical protein
MGIASLFLGSEPDPGRIERSPTEQVFFWITVLAPIWWLLGIQPLLYPLVTLGLFLRNFSVYKLLRIQLPASVWAWFLMAIVMAWTAGIALAKTGFPFQQTAAITVTFLKSYFLIFAAMALPFWSCLRSQVVTRAVSWLAAGFMVAIPLQVFMLYAGLNRFVGGEEGIKPPLAAIAPGSQSLRIFFARVEPFFGIPLPRTILYTADPPILGTCALVMFFICLGEPNPRLRRWALAGCLLGLFISFSRLSWVCFPLALGLLYILRSGWVRRGSVALGATLSFICGIVGVTVVDLLQKSLETFTSARADSSADRSVVVGKTVERWLESPWIGWGYIQHTYKWHIYEVALGSFSSYTAVLYMHGIVGMVFFVLALILTFGQFLRGALEGNLLYQRALVSLLSLYILFNGTPLTWMTVYFWFYFFWLGGLIEETESQKVTSWDDLAQPTV